MKPRRPCIALAFLLLLEFASAGRCEAGSGWPQYRGPDRDGVSRESGLLDRLPAAGPPELWRTPLGDGYSGVAVVGRRVFTMEQAGGVQYLTSLDRDTGERRWRYRIGEAFDSPYGDGPRSTPVVRGGVVFAIDAHGGLHAVRAANGAAIWSRDLVGLGGRIPSSGYASTPIVVGRRLIVEAGGPEGAFLAFDRRDGALLWSAGSDVAAYSSPIDVTLAGERQVVFFSGSGIQALSPADGRILWHHPWESLCPATGVPLNSASPIHVPPDGIVVASGYGEELGAALLRVRREGDRFEVATVWKEPVLDSRINSAVLLGERLYGFHGSSLQAVDAASGQELWRRRGYGRGSLIAAPERLIVLGENGKLGLLRPVPESDNEPDGVQILGSRSWTAPALADGRLYLRDQQQLVCLDVRDPAR